MVEISLTLVERDGTQAALGRPSLPRLVGTYRGRTSWQT